MPSYTHLRAALCVSALAVAPLTAQNLLTIDATAPVPAPRPVAAALGTARNPAGDVLGVNSQYLTFNGKPWLPVMGEFHFSRYPAAQWEEEILKMKAAGVKIVSTYVIWIHHEQTEGTFDWQGQRDLRLFTQLCAKYGMYVVPRVGPWAHAEVRNGGLPDWVLKNGPVRQNDPVYLREVQTFYQQIARQLGGLLWKDGGPVIGIQVENEYRQRGAGKGEEHIRTLKKMLVADGLDVPLYTVTGWDGAAIPLDAALPVFGGYPDAPWDGSPRALPPNEVFAFRFNNRSAGSMGAIGGHNQSNADTYRGTPFLTAEVGDGTQDTYVRRPVISPDDAAAIVPVMLGSGANLLGYYMFHGGRNPDGGAITLQESQATDYPTDVPTKSYDFQAPLGEFGQERESLRKLKLVHYFLEDFGPALAPMQPRSPDKVPTGPADVSVARVAARTSGDTGFLFLNNHVRAAEVPNRPGFQVDLKLPAGTLHIPAEPIDLPSGAYGIWPINLPLAGAAARATTLRYGTAQLFKRIESHGETFYFFFALPGVRPEFAFAPDTKVESEFGKPEITQAAGQTRVRTPEAATSELRLPGGVHLIVMPEAQAEGIWRGDDPSILLSSTSDVFSDGATWTLDSRSGPAFTWGIFGAHGQPTTAPGTQRTLPRADLFDHYGASVPAVNLEAVVTPVRPAGQRPEARLGKAVSWRPHPIPMAPDDADFASTAQTWKVTLPPVPPGSALSDVFVNIAYQGDVARLTEAGSTVDDNFWNGLPWEVGLRETQPNWRGATSFDLEVLPLRKDAALYLERAGKLQFGTSTQLDSLGSVELIPQYRIQVRVPNATGKK